MLRNSQENIFKQAYQLAITYDEEQLLNLVSDGVNLYDVKNENDEPLLAELARAGEHKAVVFLVKRMSVNANDAVMAYASLNDIEHVSVLMDGDLNNSLVEAALIGYGISNNQGQVADLLHINPELITAVIYGLAIGGHEVELMKLLTKHADLTHLAISGFILGGHFHLAARYIHDETELEMVQATFGECALFSTPLQVECALACFGPHQNSIRRLVAQVGIEKTCIPASMDVWVDDLCANVDHVKKIMGKYDINYPQAKCLTETNAVFQVFFTFLLEKNNLLNYDACEHIVSYVLGLSNKDARSLWNTLSCTVHEGPEKSQEARARFGMFAESKNAPVAKGSEQEFKFK